MRWRGGEKKRGNKNKIAEPKRITRIPRSLAINRTNLSVIVFLAITIKKPAKALKIKLEMC